MAEIEDRGEPVRILVVRSFIGADMGARIGTAATAHRGDCGMADRRTAA